MDEWNKQKKKTKGRNYFLLYLNLIDANLSYMYVVNAKQNCNLRCLT